MNRFANCPAEIDAYLAEKEPKGKKKQGKGGVRDEKGNGVEKDGHSIGDDIGSDSLCIGGEAFHDQ
jgi:hypothetical protein